MKKDRETIAAEVADIEEARLRGELHREEAQQLIDQTIAQADIPLVVLPELPYQSSEKDERVNPADIDFNYRGMSAEERIRRAVKDMEIIYASDEPPKMPPQPRFVKAYMANTPNAYQAGFSQAGFPAAAVQMGDVSFKHTNDLYYPAKIPALVVGPSGVGKNGLPPIFRFMLADLMEESHENMDRQVEVNEQNNLLGPNARRKAQPDNLVQRIVFPNTTLPALAKQMKVNHGLPCFMEVKEIEDLYGLKNGAGGISPIVLLREADDRDGRIRQRRVGEKSVTVDVPFHLNYCISATLESAHDFFRRDMTKGGLNRQEVAFIPEQPIGGKEGKYKEYDERYAKRLQPFINNLKSARDHADDQGRIYCKQAYKLIEDLKDECAAYVQTTFDRTWDNMTHRGLTHALLKACVLYVANGCKWEPLIDPYIRWSFHFCLWSKLHVFGDKIREAEGKLKYSKPGKPNLLLLINSNIFTLNDAITMRRSQGMDDSEKATKNMINVWVNRAWIKRLSDGRYEKKEYKI
jgi:hypothetical protein